MRRIFAVVGLLVVTTFLAGCSSLAAKQKAGLQVKTNDVPSSLFLNGQYLDKTPYLNKEIKPGEYTLRIQPDNPSLVAHETTITLNQGVLTVVVWKPSTLAELSGGVVYEMKSMDNRNRTELTFTTIPDNAIIKLDNQTEKVFSPTSISDVAPGEHEFEVSLPSYESQRHKINIVKGYSITATIKLAKNSVPNPPPTTPVSSSSALVAPLATRSGTPVATAAANVSSTSPVVRQPAITGPSVTIKPTRYFSDGKEVLRVRDAASNAGKEIGQAPVGTSYAYDGETANGWYAITFKNQKGWVSTQYAELKP